MKINDGFVIKEVGKDFVIIAVGKRASQFNGMIALNETGKDMFEIMQKGDFSRDSVLDGLSKIYSDFDREKVACQVDKFIFELIKVNVINE